MTGANAMARMEPYDSEVLKDIDVLRAYRAGRLEFSQRIVAASADKSDSVLSLLRSEPMHQVAEFYYRILGFGISSTDAFDALIERHNSYVTSLLADPEKMKRMALTKDRLLRAIFDGETRPRVLRIWNERPGTIDQSSLARFLVSVMSDETTRKILVAAGKAGFLTRERSVYRLVLVRSAGTMEEIYGQCLRSIRLNIEGTKQSAPAPGSPFAASRSKTRLAEMQS
jgi:hypothetical protein